MLPNMLGSCSRGTNQTSLAKKRTIGIRGAAAPAPASGKAPASQGRGLKLLRVKKELPARGCQNLGRGLVRWLSHALESSGNSEGGESGFKATVGTVSQATADLLCPSHFLADFQALKPLGHSWGGGGGHERSRKPLK